MKMKVNMHSLLPPKEEVKHKEPTVEQRREDRLPTIELDDERVPSIAGMKHGDKATLMFEGEIEGMQTGSMWDKADAKKTRARFKLHKVHIEPYPKEHNYKSMDEAAKGALADYHKKKVMAHAS